MEKLDKNGKMKISIIVLSVLVAISLSVTVYFAAFYATRSGSLTLSFADGLTMTIVAINTTDSIKCTSAGVDDYTFTYAPQINVTDNLRYSGVSATLNKPAWVSYQVSIWETTSGSAVAPSGSWSKNGSNQYYFTPSGAKSNWRTVFQSFALSFFTVTYSGNILTLVGNQEWASDALSKSIWDVLAIRNPDLTKKEYVDDLAGRNFELHFIVKASTASAPTF